MAISLAEARTASPASLPTYRTAAAVLEGRTGSGVKLAMWTVARTMLIAPPFLIVGVNPRQAWAGAAVASLLISSLTLLRIFNGGTQLEGAKTIQRRRRPVKRRRRTAQRSVR